MGLLRRLLGTERRAKLWVIVSARDARVVAGKITEHGDAYLPVFTSPYDGEEWIVGAGWDREKVALTGPITVDEISRFTQDLMEHTEFRFYSVDPPPRPDKPFKITPLALLPDAARNVEAALARP